MTYNVFGGTLNLAQSMLEVKGACTQCPIAGVATERDCKTLEPINRNNHREKQSINQSIPILITVKLLNCLAVLGIG